ncbi:MAG: LiaF transmembrane domain-containing protein [Candidatus Cyclobacteriaceae bacterium M3_2C_046]
MKSTRSNRHIIVGVIIVIIGLTLLVNNLGLMPYWLDDLLFSWQTILIALGLLALFSKDNKTPGIVLITIGAVFLIPEFFFVDARLLWPAAIIVVGLAIMFRARSKDYDYSDLKFDRSSGDYIDLLNIFSGGESLITSKNFKGGKITAIFGGSELNFMNADLDPKGAVMDIITIFGGATFLVPSDWEVVLDVQPIFGGFSDKRHMSTITDPDKKLIIKGLVLFGGGEIKSYK